ncbi:hypothetical protein PG988_013443 [Apiospora saccharicola]
MGTLMLDLCDMTAATNGKLELQRIDSLQGGKFIQTPAILDQLRFSMHCVGDVNLAIAPGTRINKRPRFGLSSSEQLEVAQRPIMLRIGSRSINQLSSHPSKSLLGIDTGELRGGNSALRRHPSSTYITSGIFRDDLPA